MTARQRSGGLANAAIWYAADGYDPGTRGINGRRVAGESFLRGFLRHATVQEIVCLCRGPSAERQFRALAQREQARHPVRAVPLEQPQGIAPLDVVSYPSPNFATEAWRRALAGPGSYAICGVTHTTATPAVMQGLFDLRAAPQMPWDALICTSRAVHASISAQMDLTDAHLAARFGGRAPPRPLMPVLPLGVVGADFARDATAGQGLRARLGIGPDDMACAIIARLTPEEKFDPLPLFIAMERAAARTGKRFHLLLCGQFRDERAQRIHVGGAQALMPSCGLHLLDGANAAERRATLSGADVFLFPIDNVQETFGLAPVEAMSAGLPVIASDWDGLRDTVTPDCGFLIPTEMAQGDLTRHLGQRLFGGTDGYVQYVDQLAALTRIDLRRLTDALAALGSDEGLRRRMGQAALRRARAFDWQAVIPQYQALWAEQAAMLRHARKTGCLPPPLRPQALPPAPAPGVFFRAYPTTTGPSTDRRYRAVAAPGLPDPATTFALRDYVALRRLVERPELIASVLDGLSAAGQDGIPLPELAQARALPPQAVMRATIWLMKYGYAEEAGPTGGA